MWASAFVAACGVALDQVHVEVLINSKSEVVTCGAHQDAAVAASIFCAERGIGAEQSCTDHIADAIRTEQNLHASTLEGDDGDAICTPRSDAGGAAHPRPANPRTGEYLQVDPVLLDCDPADVVRTTTAIPFGICVFPQSTNDIVSNELRKFGVWEKPNTDYTTILLQLAAPGSVYLDGGAYLGYYTMLAASYGLRVVAFEPVRPQRERLLASIRLNGFQDQIAVFPYALSDQDMAFKSMVSQHQNFGSSIIKSDRWEKDMFVDPAGSAEPVRAVPQGILTIRLDTIALGPSWCESKAVGCAGGDEAGGGGGGGGGGGAGGEGEDEGGGRGGGGDEGGRRPEQHGHAQKPVYFMKVDVEGHAGFLLQGARRFFSDPRHSPAFLLLEVVPFLERSNGCSSAAMVRFFYRNGYAVCPDGMMLSNGYNVGEGSGFDGGGGGLIVELHCMRLEGALRALAAIEERPLTPAERRACAAAGKEDTACRDINNIPFTDMVSSVVRVSPSDVSMAGAPAAVVLVWPALSRQCLLPAARARAQHARTSFTLRARSPFWTITTLALCARRSGYWLDILILMHC
jgi:FkbM family methyltransferase